MVPSKLGWSCGMTWIPHFWNQDNVANVRTTAFPRLTTGFYALDSTAGVAENRVLFHVVRDEKGHFWQTTTSVCRSSRLDHVDFKFKSGAQTNAGILESVLKSYVNNSAQFRATDLSAFLSLSLFLRKCSHKIAQNCGEINLNLVIRRLDELL